MVRPSCVPREHRSTRSGHVADRIPANGNDIPSLAHIDVTVGQVDADRSLCQSNDRLARIIADGIGCEGPVINISSACAGASQAIGNAFQMIRREKSASRWRVAPIGVQPRHHGRVVSVGCRVGEQRWGADLCRPFDRDRSGLIAGEGGGFVVLESLEHALARGATPYAEVLGFGSSLDAYKVTAPQPEGRGAALAMQTALDDAGLRPQQIDLINAHGTSTPLNDVAETLAIKSVFAEHKHYRTPGRQRQQITVRALDRGRRRTGMIVTALACHNDR